MHRIIHYLVERVLPVWVKGALLAENDRLVQENQRLRQRVRQLEAYTQGLEKGIRLGGGKKGTTQGPNPTTLPAPPGCPTGVILSGGRGPASKDPSSPTGRKEKTDPSTPTAGLG